MANSIADKVVKDAIQEASKSPLTYHVLSLENELETYPISKISEINVSSSKDAIIKIKPISKKIQKIASLVYGNASNQNTTTETRILQSSSYNTTFESNKENQQELSTPLGFKNHSKNLYDTQNAIKNETLNKSVNCASPQQIFIANELQRHPNAQFKEGQFLRNLIGYF